MSPQKVVVVGAGIVGLASAAVLVARGCSVTVVDREGPAAGASQGNAGGIAWTDVRPLASPGIMGQAIKWMLDPLGPLSIRPAYALKALPWFLRFARASSPAQVQKSTTALAALNDRAWDSWQTVWKLTGTHNQVQRKGCLQVFDTKSSFENARARWAEQRSYGIEVRELTGDECREVEPELSNRVVGGAFVPAWSQVDDPKKLCLSIYDWLKTQGVEFVVGDAKSAVPGGRGPEVHLSDERVLTADKVVIACGAWSKKLAVQLGDKVPLDTERGYNITIPEPGLKLSTFVMLSGHGFAVSHLEHGLRVGGAVEFAGLDLPPNWKRVDAMLSKAKIYFPQLQSDTGKRWMGFRPSLPDSLPVIGKSSASPDIVYGFGHAHHGLTEAAVTAEMLSALMFDEVPVVDATPFSAARFK
ncbi:MAG: FAD-dependent oxidoreductase [Rhodobacteraceae bacterium]|nr:FAD-dependent oxidoreductase [Paracoccaceae bacterium]